MEYTGRQTSIWASRFLFPVAVWPWATTSLICETRIITLSLQTLIHHWQWGMALLWLADYCHSWLPQIFWALCPHSLLLFICYYSLIHLLSASKGINPASQVRSPNFPASLANDHRLEWRLCHWPHWIFPKPRREGSMKCTMEGSSQRGKQLKCIHKEQL